MVWSIALANILGAGLCYAFSPQFARLATLRYTLILPAVLGIVYIGAFEANRSWGDLFALLFFGVLGWLMKQHKWPRPPLVLGLVLGDTIERYMFISVERYGFTWLWRPVVAVLLILAIIGLLRPLYRRHPPAGRRRQDAVDASRRRASIRCSCSRSSSSAIIGIMMTVAMPWHFSAKLVPLVVGTIGADGRRPEPVQRPVPQAGRRADRAASPSRRSTRSADGVHMDIDVRHRSSAGANHRRRARRAVLRLPARRSWRRWP